MSEAGRLATAADRIEDWLTPAWPPWIAHGIDPGNGLFVEDLDPAGRPERAVPRRVRVRGCQLHCFSRADAFGHVLRPELDRTFDAIAATAARVTGRVLDTILATDPVGLWIDQFDGSGRTCRPGVPASTPYHLVVAFGELLRAAGRGRPDALRPFVRSGWRSAPGRRRPAASARAGGSP